METSSLGGEPLTIEYGNAQTTGGATPVSVSCAPASGTRFPAGTTTVTCTATDAASQTAACTFGVTVSAIPRLLKTRFVAFGDSLTEGKLSVLTLFLFDAGPQSYPSQLQRLLDERYTGQNANVINEGFGGKRADDDVPRLRTALSTHRPDAVLLMHGVNDLNDLNSATSAKVQATVDAIEELTKEASYAGITPLVATLPPLRLPKAGCPECVEPLNDRIRSMVAAKGAVLVDVYAAWGNREGLMGADGIHPTEAGYQVIAATFLDAIRRTFEAAPGDR